MNVCSSSHAPLSFLTTSNRMGFMTCGLYLLCFVRYDIDQKYAIVVYAVRGAAIAYCSCRY